MHVFFAPHTRIYIFPCIVYQKNRVHRVQRVQLLKNKALRICAMGTLYPVSGYIIAEGMFFDANAGRNRPSNTEFFRSFPIFTDE